MDYFLTKNKAEDIQEKISEIGKLSLLLIKYQEQYSKDEYWERAVEINKLGKDLYKDISHLPRI